VSFTGRVGDDQIAPHVGSLPERMHMKLVEPPAVFKDEVAILGRGLTC
jgi:GMP synthase PP-ATPase subunit